MRCPLWGTKDNNGEMRPTRRPLQTTRSRVVSAALAGAFVLAACGGGGDSGGDAAGEDSSSAGNDAEAATEAESVPAPADELSVAPESDVETNVLPDVVVDNVTLGNQVNLRNVSPSDKVQLVWMWAPN